MLYRMVDSSSVRVQLFCQCHYSVCNSTVTTHNHTVKFCRTGCIGCVRQSDEAARSTEDNEFPLPLHFTPSAAFAHHHGPVEGVTDMMVAKLADSCRTVAEELLKVY